MKRKLYKTAVIRPFVYTVPSITVTTITMLFLLCVQVIMLAITESYNAIFVIMASCAGTVAASYIVNLYHRSNKFSVILMIVQGIMTGMLLPETYPIPTVLMTTFFVTMFCKILSGKLTHAWYNSVALVVAILWIIGASEFPVSLVSAETASLSNPSLALIQSGNIQILKYDHAITDFLNRNIFGLFNISVPDGYVSLMWDNLSVIPAFRFNIITIISSVILISVDMITFFVPLIFLFSYSLLIRFIMPLFFGGVFGQGDILLATLTGGTLFCTLYLLQWFGTVPSTMTGKIIYAFCGGVIAFFICGYGMASAGMVFVILIIDVISSVIQAIEEKQNIKKIKTMMQCEEYNG